MVFNGVFDKVYYNSDCRRNNNCKITDKVNKLKKKLANNYEVIQYKSIQF